MHPDRTDAARSAADRRDPHPPELDQLDLAIPSDVAQIEQVVDAVVARCQAHHYSRRACALNVPVALTEALANAIVSGNREDAAKHVRVRASVGELELVLEVHDEGPGFEFGAQTWGPDDPDAHDREDGRGLFLMRRLMDHVEQFAGPERGHVIRMTLRRLA